jgi:hypothetical protein
MLRLEDTNASNLRLGRHPKRHRAAIRPVSYACSTRRRCSFPTAAATTDSLRNIVHDPRVALLLLIPGVGETMRVIGHAAISTDPELTASFAMNGKVPTRVIVVDVERVYFQCTKAIVRAKLWDPAQHVERKSLPTPGMIVEEITDGRLGGEAHDRAAPERVKAALY